MKPTAGINKFSNRLDEIFEQGMPTKAQILDAYNKAVKSEPAEGAEEFLDGKYNGYYHCLAGVLCITKEGAVKSMQEFAALHAQRLADKMVEGMYPKEFVKWKDKNVMRGYGGWIFNYGANLSARFKDYDELFNYWKENVK